MNLDATQFRRRQTNVKFGLAIGPLYARAANDLRGDLLKHRLVFAGLKYAWLPNLAVVLDCNSYWGIGRPPCALVRRVVFQVLNYIRLGIFLLIGLRRVRYDFDSVYWREYGRYRLRVVP